MTFRQTLQSDRDVFLNLDEFAEYIKIDGVILKAQFQDYTQPKSGNDKKNYFGLHGDFSVVYFKTDEYCVKRERIPHEGEVVEIDGKRYTVNSARDEKGITRLEIEAYRQGQLRGENFRRYPDYDYG